MKKTKIILLIMGILIIVLGVTYAIYTWSGLVTVKGTAKCFDVTYVKGRNIGSNENKATLELGNSAKDGLSSTAMLSSNPHNINTITPRNTARYLPISFTSLYVFTAKYISIPQKNDNINILIKVSFNFISANVLALSLIIVYILVYFKMNPTKKAPIKLPIKVIINSLIYFLLKLLIK